MLRYTVASRSLDYWWPAFVVPCCGRRDGRGGCRPLADAKNGRQLRGEWRWEKRHEDTAGLSLSLSLPNGKNQIDCATLWKQRRTKQTRKTKTIITRMSEMESIPVSPQYQREKKRRNCRSTNEETGRRNSLFFLVGEAERYTAN